MNWTNATFLLVLAIPAAMGRADQHEASKQSAQFKAVADLVNQVQMTTNFSKDKEAVTVLFRNLLVSVGGIKGGPSVDTKVVTVALPIQSKGKSIQLCQIVRGYVNISGKGRAVLIVQSAGQTAIVQLPKGKGKKTNFDHVAHLSLPEGMNYQVTFFLLVERDTDNPQEGCLLTIDSLDVELGKKAKNQP